MISNKRLKEIKNVANYKELHEKIYPEKPYNDNKDEYVGVYDIQELSLHEFGSGADYLQNMPKKSQKKIFLNKEFNENVTAEDTFYLTNKDGLLHIIESLRKIMESYYQKRWRGCSRIYEKTYEVCNREYTIIVRKSMFRKNKNYN